MKNGSRCLEGRRLGRDVCILLTVHDLPSDLEMGFH